MGCLQADGRERLLWSFVPTEGPASVTEAALAGNYAALAINSTNYKYQQQGTGVELFDLRTGCELQVQDTYCDPSVPDRAGENAGCDYSSSPPCATSMDQLVLGSDAVSAVHVTEVDNGCTCTVEQIQASDSTGLHTPDSVTEPDGTPTTLTNLALTGDTLTWDHNGAPMSAQLQP
jgi:hypothetical protein